MTFDSVYARKLLDNVEAQAAYAVRESTGTYGWDRVATAVKKLRTLVEELDEMLDDG